MLKKIIQTLTPHYCYACGEIGSVLCSNCKYNIINEYTPRCIVCSVPSRDGSVCIGHDLPFESSWCVGERADTLKMIVDAKYYAVREAAMVQALLLDAILPYFEKSVFVPVPTSAAHIRQRGYGHSEYIARELAKIRSTHYCPAVTRRNNTTQHGSSRTVRIKQARNAYEVKECLDDDTLYIIVDDVYTTGATVINVAQQLSFAGARHIGVAITTRQTLE